MWDTENKGGLTHLLIMLNARIYTKHLLEDIHSVNCTIGKAVAYPGGGGHPENLLGK